jgi:hypothetical protein
MTFLPLNYQDWHTFLEGKLQATCKIFEYEDEEYEHYSPLGPARCSLTDRHQHFRGIYFHHLEAREPEVASIRFIRNSGIFSTSLPNYTGNNTEGTNLHLTTMPLTFADLRKPWNLL